MSNNNNKKQILLASAFAFQQSMVGTMDQQHVTTGWLESLVMQAQPSCNDRATRAKEVCLILKEKRVTSSQEQELQHLFNNYTTKTYDEVIQPIVNHASKIKSLYTAKQMQVVLDAKKRSQEAAKKARTKAETKAKKEAKKAAQATTNTTTKATKVTTTAKHVNGKRKNESNGTTTFYKPINSTNVNMQQLERGHSESGTSSSFSRKPTKRAKLNDSQACASLLPVPFQQKSDNKIKASLQEVSNGSKRCRSTSPLIVAPESTKLGLVKVNSGSFMTGGGPKKSSGNGSNTLLGIKQVNSSCTTANKKQQAAVTAKSSNGAVVVNTYNSTTGAAMTSNSTTGAAKKNNKVTAGDDNTKKKGVSGGAQTNNGIAGAKANNSAGGTNKSNKNKSKQTTGGANSDTTTSVEEEHSPIEEDLLLIATSSTESPLHDGLLFYSEPATNTDGWWSNDNVTWTEHATTAMKAIMKNDMHVGIIQGLEAASADFADDVNKFNNWLQFNNGRITTSDDDGNLDSILDSLEHWRSLEPLFCTITKWSSPSLKTTPPKAWLHGKQLEADSKFDNTLASHYDRPSPSEKYTQRHFGREKCRLRIALTMTPPTTPHEGQQKETKYRFNNKTICSIRGGVGNYVLMGSFSNGKNKLFMPQVDDDDDKEEIDDLFDGLEYTEEEADLPESEHCERMRHGINNNSGSLSTMIEITLEPGTVRKFIADLETCYNNYKPKNAPVTINTKQPLGLSTTSRKTRPATPAVPTVEDDDSSSCCLTISSVKQIGGIGVVKVVKADMLASLSLCLDCTLKEDWSLVTRWFLSRKKVERCLTLEV